MDLLTANDQQGAYPNSYYAATAVPLVPFPNLTETTRCDVCVVGAGFTGLSAALHLAQAGLDVVVVDAQRVGFGASGRNGGQVGVGQRVEQPDLESMVPAEDAQKLWDMGLDAVGLVKSLIAEHQMDVGWADGIIETAHRLRYVPDYQHYADHMRAKYGYEELRVLDREQVQHEVGSPAYYGGVLDMGGGHMHPLRFVLGLAKAAQNAGVRIFENTRATSITPGAPAQVQTANGHVTADHVIVAANGYLGGLLPQVAQRVMPINNFIAATRPLSDDEAANVIRNNHAVADSKFVINYFRLSQDKRLLFGGGENYGYRFPNDIAAFVRKPMAQIYPHLSDIQIDYAWGGTLGITMSRLPHLTRIDGNILSAGGFSGHGIALGTYSGKILAEAIKGQAGQFDLMAGLPTPRFPGGGMLRQPLLVLAMLWYGLRDRL
jgi:gamma-glutamylputrescine oxidase